MAEATSIKDCVQRHVEYPFDVYETELYPLQKTRLSLMYRKVPKEARALDIGCNSGYAAIFRADCDWYGVDVSPPLVTKAAQRMNAQVAQAEDLPYEDDFFDCAVLGEILEHVYDPRRVVAEAARVTQTSIVGTTPHDRGGWGKHTIRKHRFHVRAFSSTELTTLLSEFGEVSIEDVLGQFWLFEVKL